MKRVAGILIFLFIVSSFLPNIYRSLVKTQKLEKELKDFEDEKVKIQTLIGYYTQEIENLKHIEIKEQVVRNKLQMVKPGEIIYRVIE